VLRALTYFRPFLQSLQIHAGMALLHLTRAIFCLLQELDIRLHVMHIPGIENCLADSLSRMEASGDYELRADVFRIAVRTLQVIPTIDLFASAYNKKLDSFVSLEGRYSKGAAHLDAFSLPTWNLGLPYIFPPVGLIDRVLQRIQTEKIEAVLVLPKWPYQPWWGLFKPMAKKVLELGSGKEVLRPGPLMTESASKKLLPPGLFLMALLTPD
jgi:hypothetical protein